MSRFGTLTGKTPGAVGGAAPSFAPSAAPDLVEVVGYLDNIRVFGDWAIGSVWTEDRETLKITGQAVKELQEGSQYKLAGRMKSHPRYGDSLDVVSAMPHVHLDKRAIAKYMEANFDGIGPKSAKKMVEYAIDTGGQDALERLRQQLLNEPWTIDWSPAKREGNYSAEKEETTSAFVHRDLTTRLGGMPGMTGPVLNLLSRWVVGARAVGVAGVEKTSDPVADSWRILTHNPYAPIEDVSGYGFLLADAIGRVVNIPLDSPQRLGALVAYALSRGCDMEGHVFLTEQQMNAAIQQVDKMIRPARAIEFGLEEGAIVLDVVHGQRRFYTPKLQEAEEAVVEAVCNMMDSESPLLTDVRGLEDKIQTAFRQGKKNASKVKLDPSQMAAIHSALISPSRLHVITGGPGTGKTDLVETIVKMLPGRTFHFGAPTGKAAKVLSSRIAPTGNKAHTVHSLLRGSEDGWQVNQEEPLVGDVLVVDEGSMPPLELYKAILDACNSGMHIIVVGDPNQLQSIQPGRVLSDLILIPGVNHSHLTEVHRNGGGILDVVNEIGRGEINTEDRPNVTFSHGLGEAEDFFPVVMQSYLDAVGRRGIENVILMISRRQGKVDEPGWNTTYANAVLRELLNPNAEKLPGSGSLHVGDRIIIRDNMLLKQKSDRADDAGGSERTEDVVNGDTGEIKSYERYPAGKKDNGVAWLRIKLDDGRTIDYPGTAIKALDHSYASTVHAAQGSEYAEVLGVFTPGVPSFINRTSLYTGASRPRGHMHFFAEDHVLRRIAATLPPQRNSALVEKVLEKMGNTETDTDEQVAAARSRFRMVA